MYNSLGILNRYINIKLGKTNPVYKTDLAVLALNKTYYLQEVMMSLRKEDKDKIIKEFQTSPRDTASPQVQVALLTSRLVYLNKHFKSNKKDHHSRRGLMKMVGQRRQLLNYLQHSNKEEYKSLITKLGIRK